MFTLITLIMLVAFIIATLIFKKHRDFFKDKYAYSIKFAFAVTLIFSILLDFLTFTIGWCACH